MEARDRRHNAVSIGLILSLALMVALSFQAHAQSLQLGGWESSTLFQRTGSVDTQRLFDRSGSAETSYVFATSPNMVTGAATGSTYTPDTPNSGTVTLHGTVNLNGMPRATVGFRYGYSSNNLSFNTSTVTVSGNGAYQVVLTGFDQTVPVYFQAVGVTDGIAYGIGSVFTITRTITPFTGYERFLMISPLLIWVALLIAAGMLVFSGIGNIRNATGNTAESTTGMLKIGIAVIFLAVAMIMFGIIPEIIYRIRIM